MHPGQQSERILREHTQNRRPHHRPKGNLGYCCHSHTPGHSAGIQPPPERSTGLHLPGN